MAWGQAEDRANAMLSVFKEVRDPNEQRGKIVANMLSVWHQKIVLKEGMFEMARNALNEELLVCGGKESGATIAHIAWKT